MTWGVIEQRDDDNLFLAYHVMPMIVVDNESVPSDFHIASKECPCHPRYKHGDKHNTDIWSHNDPDHPGALI